MNIDMGVGPFILLSLLPVTLAAMISTEETNAQPCDPFSEGCISAVDCNKVCGCDKSLIYDEQKGYCVVNIAYLRQLSAATNYVSEENDMTVEDGIATKIRERVDRVFRGIIISAIFFIACASICAISVCIFCCHVRNSDSKLKKEVNALAKKMNIKVNKDSTPLVKNPRDPIAQSCNVTVTDADIMCV